MTLSHVVRLEAARPFSYSESLAYLGRSNEECLYRIDRDRVYKLFESEGEQHVLELSPGEEGGIRLAVAGAADGRFLDAAAGYVREWFDLDAEVSAFYRIGLADPLLGPAVRRFEGLRLIGVTDLFEALVWSIIGQQISLPFAYKLKRAFVESFGRSSLHDGERLWLFPSPHDVAGLSVSQLTDLKLTTRKAEYMVHVAELVASGELSKEGLLGLGEPSAIERRLVSIRGIGPWTANYVMMRCLRIPTAFPTGDVGLQHAIRIGLGREEKPTEAEIRALATGWAGWESYATFYLWRLLY